jgi:hypothetical protein
MHRMHALTVSLGLGPDQVRVNPSIVLSIEQLCKDPGNVVVIFSGGLHG